MDLDDAATVVDTSEDLVFIRESERARCGLRAADGRLGPHIYL